MNAFYKLACALVAWSALSLSNGALAGAPLSALPASAFDLSAAFPDRLGFVYPGTELAHYRSVLLEPLSFLSPGKNGEWMLLRAQDGNLFDQHLRAQLAAALAAHGVEIATAPSEHAMRLALALACDQAPEAVDTVLDLTTLGAGVEHYMTQVRAVGQLVDARSRQLLAGSAELTGLACSSPARPDELPALLDRLSQASADRIALALGRLGRSQALSALD